MSLFTQSFVDSVANSRLSQRIAGLNLPPGIGVIPLEQRFSSFVLQFLSTVAQACDATLLASIRYILQLEKGGNRKRFH
jgi:hypothetical protein